MSSDPAPLRRPALAAPSGSNSTIGSAGWCCSRRSCRCCSRCTAGPGRETPDSGVPGSCRSADEVLEAFLAGLPESVDLVLFPHSNAALPTTSGRTRLAPPEFYEFLAGLADEQGLLPPWTQWWGEGDLGDLFPTDEWRHRVEAEQPRLPLSYFRSTVEVPAGWADEPAAYVGFGGTYAAELELARESGWPVTVLDGGHLHMLHDPSGVARSIVELLAKLDATHSAPEQSGGDR